MSIALLDRQTSMLAMPYYLEHGERFPVEPLPLGVGLTGHVIETRAPLVISENLPERAASSAQPIGDAPVPTWAMSYLGVPILKGDEALGVDQRSTSHEARTPTATPTCGCCRRSPTR